MNMSAQAEIEAGSTSTYNFKDFTNNVGVGLMIIVTLFSMVMIVIEKRAYDKQVEALKRAKRNKRQGQRQGQPQRQVTRRDPAVEESMAGAETPPAAAAAAAAAGPPIEMGAMSNPTYNSGPQRGPTMITRPGKPQVMPRPVGAGVGNGGKKPSVPPKPPTRAGSASDA
eukprot:UC1_evm1s820